MAEKSLEERIDASKSRSGQNRCSWPSERAEVIEQIFARRFEEFEKRQDAKWDARLDGKLTALERRLNAKWDKRFVALEDLTKTILAQ